jgi:hypothetical protein
VPLKSTHAITGPSLFCAARGQWPAIIVELFRLMSVFNFNIDITAPECTLKQLTYETKWWIVMQVGSLSPRRPLL